MAAPALGDLTWEEVRDLAAAGAVAILPIGAVEAHGPHLPLGTDVIIADAMARAGADRLRAAGRAAVIFPPLSYTPAGFASAFPGTVSLADATFTAVLTDIARSAARHGFRVLALANAHLDPGHLAALERAVTAVRAEGAIRVAYPNVVRRALAQRLTDEFRSGACHAGRYEGSIVLAERPELVRTEVAAALPANPASLSDAIRDGKTSFEEAGGPRAYFGAPAEATAEEGRRTIDTLGALLAEAVAEADRG